MKTLSVLILTLFIAPLAFAADIDGTFQCDDGATLEVTQSRQLGSYYASLEYADGSASTLAEFQFRGESLRGNMLRDDEDANMGKVIIADQGRRLVLNFDSGETVTCLK